MRTGEIQTSQLINRLIAFPHNTISIAFCFSCKCKRSQYTFGENQNWIPCSILENWKCKSKLQTYTGQQWRATRAPFSFSCAYYNSLLLCTSLFRLAPSPPHRWQQFKSDIPQCTYIVVQCTYTHIHTCIHTCTWEIYCIPPSAISTYNHCLTSL